MWGFIYSNRNWLSVVGVLAFLLVMYFIFKALPTKVAKKQKAEKTSQKEENIATEKSDSSEEKKEETNSKTKEDLNKEKTQNEDKNSQKDDKKPKIVQIYKRERSENKEEKSEKIDPIYNRNIEFVNVSKNVSKFKSFTDEAIDNTELDDINGEKDEFGFVRDNQDDCEFCEDKVKHFDHSRRLSSVMKDDNHDDMFASHISDKYLNINSEKHLKLDEKFHNMLYSRMADMVINSKSKINSSPEMSYNAAEEFRDDEIEDDDVKINMKTALIADTYFNRKKKR